jgi:hypothetical protein
MFIDINMGAEASIIMSFCEGLRCVKEERLLKREIYILFGKAFVANGQKNNEPRPW